jgi:hypothetical protein
VVSAATISATRTSASRGAAMWEIGRLLYINESRVSRIHKRALARMAAARDRFGIASSSSISVS